MLLLIVKEVWEKNKMQASIIQKLMKLIHIFLWPIKIEVDIIGNFFF